MSSFITFLREYARENEPNKTQMLRWGRPIFAKIAPGVGLGLKTHQATIFSKIFGGKFEFWSVFGRFFPIFLKLREAIWGAKNEFRRGFNAFLWMFLPKFSHETNIFLFRWDLPVIRRGPWNRVFGANFFVRPRIVKIFRSAKNLGKIMPACKNSL